MGVLDTMGSATRGTREETLILDAALAARWDELNQSLLAATNTDDKDDAGSLAVSSVTRIATEMEEIRGQVEASQVTFEFEPMDWADKVLLQAEHPPRDGNVADRLRGFNVSTFVPAIIKACCVKVTDAAGDEATEIPDEKWDHLLGNPDADPPIRPALAPGQVTKLFVSAQDSNQGESKVPPSARFLLESLDSGASLAQPSPGTPPPSGGTGGSPRTSRRTSTAKKAASTKAESSES